LTSAELFSETPGRFLVSVPSEYSAEFAAALATDAVKIGQTAGDSLKLTLKDQAADLPVAELKQIWEEALPCLMKSKD
jgi:phosphoribosylformylglycinamidine synthase